MVHVAGDTGWVAWTNSVDTSVAANTTGVAANTSGVAANVTAITGRTTPADVDAKIATQHTADNSTYAPISAGSTMGTPTSSSTFSTPTTGTTEVRDAVLGNYSFTAIAGHRYRAIVDGLSIFTTVAGDVAQVNVRNGGSSTPTATSTLVATTYTPALSAAVNIGCAPTGTFVPGAGVVTLSLFLLRGLGTGVEQTSAFRRELYAVDLGPA